MASSIDFLVRRPIFNSSVETVGYDLVFESDGSSDDAARLIVEGVAGIELPDLLRGCPGFVSVGATFLDPRTLVHLPGIGFDLLPDVTIDEQLAEGIRSCTRLEIPIAVSDAHRDSIAWLGLENSVTWSRLDAEGMTTEALRSSFKTWNAMGVSTIVDGVSTRAQQQVLSRLGVEWFSGSFSSESPVGVARISPGKASVLRLLSALFSPESSLGDIAVLVEEDPAISYRLLRLLNSARYGLSRTVASVKEAVILLGPQQIASVVSLIAMAGLEDVQSEAMTTAVQRGRMCERLARENGEVGTSSFFLVGVLSTLDQVLHMPLDDIISGLPLDPKVVGGVLRREGPLGAALTVATAYEEARWDDVRRFEWSSGAVRRSYLDSVAWATSLATQLVA